MAVTASKLRQDIYRILDEALATGEPVEVARRGRRLLIVPDGSTDRLSRLVSRSDVVVGDSEDFVHLDWSDQWRG
jgi:antitoxin (DNA-binding transcriptional repressor) of toxin-antitoxin stability system